MNKIGIFYAYWTQDWNVDFKPLVDKAANLGFDVLEVNGGILAEMSPAERKVLKDHADARGISLSYCYGLPAKYDVASPDASVRREGLRFLEKMTRAVGEMGGGRLSGILYGCWPTLMPEDTYDRAPYLERSIASVKEASRVAEDHHVVYNLEVVNRFEQYLFNTAAEAVEYVQAVGSPNVKIHLDTYHMNIEEDTFSAAIETAGEHLGHLHVGENNRRPPGYGHIPWEELFSALKRIDYQGWIVMEPFLRPGGPVARDIRVWRDLSVGYDLDEEAAKAVRFIRGKLAAA